MSNLSDFVGSGGIRPPSPAESSVMGLPSAAEMNGTEYLPMNISAEGEYLDIANNSSVTHYDEQSSLIWTTAISSVQALADRLSALYWDKVDDRLYILTYDTVNSLAQFAWLNTLTGAVTLLGSTFASAEIDQAPDFDQISMTRAVQGTGNFLLTLANTTGLGSLEIPPAGGSTTNVVSNILVGNVEPKLSAPYKIDTNLYVDNIRGGLTTRFNFIDIVTDKGQVVDAPFFLAGGGHLGAHNDSTGLATDVYIRDWGDDVALLFTASTAYDRSCPAVFDKTDFHRFVKEVAAANSLRNE